MNTKRYFTFIFGALLLMTAAVCSCGRKEGAKEDAVALREMKHELPDTLRVGTLYGPTSYFLYREQPMGYDYEVACEFAKDKHVAMRLEVFPNLQRAIEVLDSGKIDVLAYEVPLTADNVNRIVPCGIEAVNYQVLVQPMSKSGKLITDVTQLVGRDVYVEKNSKYHQRITNLNEELGGGVKIHAMERDSLLAEDMIEMVSQGEIPLTIVDSDIAKVNRTYFKNVDISLKVSFEQKSAWGVSKKKPWLADSINSWLHTESLTERKDEILRRYFELSKTELQAPVILFSKGRISPFDHLFKRYAKLIDWDWRLLAAQGYCESHFDSTVVSWAGARGVMQLMPATARANGLGADRITNNDANISTAVKVIAGLEKIFKPKVHDEKERLRFVVAAYNSGAAHILDAIALARKHGLNAEVWDDNVSKALLWKSRSEYYNDPVCRHGYFKGTQTCEYVKQVFNCYDRIKKVSE